MYETSFISAQLVHNIKYLPLLLILRRMPFYIITSIDMMKICPFKITRAVVVRIVSVWEIVVLSNKKNNINELEIWNSS